MARSDGGAIGRFRDPPARVLVVTGAISVQFGAAFATHLFGRVGASGAVSLRLALAAVVLVAVLARSQGDRDRLRTMNRADLRMVVAFGLVLAGMNLSFYEAISRIPLGVAVTIEFAGPLVVTLLGSRRRSDLVWALLAAGGVVLLAGRISDHLDAVGAGLALLAGVFWGAYIHLSSGVGRRFEGTTGLTLAMVVSTVAVLPVGIAHAGSRLFEPGVLALGAGVALMSSVVPYSLELKALRRLTPRAFGILMSADPAVAAIAGLIVLGQRLSWTELVALVLVVAANVGSTITDRTTASGRVPIETR